MQVVKQQLELDIEQQSGSKLRNDGCILSPCLFNLYSEYIMWNPRLEEAQAGIKIAGRNINNLRYADETTLMAESEEELNSLLMRVKEENEDNVLMEESTCLTSDYTTKPQSSRQYGIGTKTDI